MSSRLTKAGKYKAETDLLRTIKGHVRDLKGYKDNEVRLLAKIEQQGEELTELKQDYTKLINLECRQCLKQEALIKENKTMFKYVVSMAVITILTLVWGFVR